MSARRGRFDTPTLRVTPGFGKRRSTQRPRTSRRSDIVTIPTRRDPENTGSEPSECPRISVAA